MYKIFYKAYKNSKAMNLIDERAIYSLQKLNKQHIVDLVTARDSNYKEYLLERLEILGIKQGSHYNNLIHVEPKPYDLKLQLNHDVIIDDNPNLVESIKKFPHKTLFLYDQPWNQHSNESVNVKRIRNWAQIGILLKEIQELTKSEEKLRIS